MSVFAHRVSATFVVIFIFWCLWPPVGRGGGALIAVSLFAWAFIALGRAVASLLGDPGGTAGARAVDIIVRGIGWILLVICLVIAITIYW